MKEAVAEPLQNVLEHLPPIQLPSVVIEHLPERFQPAPPRRSRKPLLFLVLLALGGVAVFMVMRRRAAGGEEIPTYDGASTSMGKAPFVDVR